MCGLDPGPHTVGELAAMLEARERSEWARQASLLCLVANGFVGLGGKRKTFKPSDFDPFEARAGEVKGRIGVAEFGRIMFGNRARTAQKATVKREDPDDHPPADGAAPDGADDRVRVPG